MPEILSKIAAQLIEWLQQYSWVLTLLLAIPLSILANLLTDPFKQWMASRSFEQSRKRVKQLESELDYATKLVQDREKLSLESTKVILTVLIDIGLGGATSSLLFLAGFVFYLMAVLEGYRHMRLLNRVANFDEYKRNTELRISKLKTSAVYNADKQLHVQSASYGAGERTKDVAQPLNSKIVAGRLEIRVNNGNLAGDPAPKIVKELRVAYSYDGQLHSKVIPENEMLSLP